MNEIKQYEKPSLAVRDQVNQIQALMQNALINGTHYGTVPGCGSKPTLLQPGAEKIALMFNWAADYEIDRSDLEGGHREYDVKCELVSRATGEHVGCGVGLWTTSTRATKSTAAASDIFTQDIEDMGEIVVEPVRDEKPVQGRDHIQPIRDLFVKFCADAGLTPEEGVRAVCAYAGVNSMQEIKPEQVADVCDFMSHANAILSKEQR